MRGSSPHPRLIKYSGRTPSGIIDADTRARPQPSVESSTLPPSRPNAPCVRDADHGTLIDVDGAARPPRRIFFPVRLKTVLDHHSVEPPFHLETHAPPATPPARAQTVTPSTATDHVPAPAQQDRTDGTTQATAVPVHTRRSATIDDARASHRDNRRNSRLFDRFKSLFDKDFPKFAEKFAKIEGIELARVHQSVQVVDDPDDPLASMPQSDPADNLLDYSKIRAKLREQTGTAGVGRTVAEIATEIKTEADEKSSGEAALKSARRINAMLQEIDVSTADTSTLSGIATQLETSINRADRLKREAERIMTGTGGYGTVNICLEYHSDRDLGGTISADSEIPLHLWNRLCAAVLGVQGDAEIVDSEIHLSWNTVLSVASEIASLRNVHGFGITYNAAARDGLFEFREEVREVVERRVASNLDFDGSDIDSRLVEAGFSRRQLTDEQRRDTAYLIGLRNGANFSVPGAGKTSVAVAVHLLTRTPNSHLLVVAPKNAFGAWDEAISDCMDDSVVDDWRVIRLVGGSDSIHYILSTLPRTMIISYDQLCRVQGQVRLFLRSHPTHVILDESHRITSGQRAQRGEALLRLADLAVRRDILSGTPITNSNEDICAQLDFLWPGQRLGWQAVSSSDLNQVIGPFYVRTTKTELGLPAISRQHIGIDMASSQLALYSMVRREILSQQVQIQNRRSLRSARRSVMRLLQVSSNPILAVRGLFESIGDSTHFEDPALDAIVQDVISLRDSPRILKACELARQLASDDLQSVIWTSFTANVERIAELLADLGAVYIHGGVDSGDVDDANSREGRIRMFHDRVNGCRVLVANPAACAERISLHRVCHHAIYVDRTYNAAHYLQSEDRIHRLGLPAGVETCVYILESIAPSAVGSIDYSVRRRLASKFGIMSKALDDRGLSQLELDEEEDDVPLDSSITIEDLIDLIGELTCQSTDCNARLGTQS